MYQMNGKKLHAIAGLNCTIYFYSLVERNDY